MTNFLPKLKKLKYFDVDTEEELALNSEVLQVHANLKPSNIHHTDSFSEDEVHLNIETPSTPRNHDSKLPAQATSHSQRPSIDYSGTPKTSNRHTLLPIKPKVVEKNNIDLTNKSPASLSRNSFRSVTYASEYQSYPPSVGESLVDIPPSQRSQYETNRSFKTQTSVDTSKPKSIRQRLEIPKKYDPEDQIKPKELSGMHVMFTQDEIKNAFDTFDMDKNGFISAEEIRTIMEAIGEYVTDEEIDEMIRMLDYEGKGQVGFSEFFKMATGQTLGPIGAALPPSPMMVNTQSNRTSARTQGTVKVLNTETGRNSAKSRVSTESNVEDGKSRGRSLESDRVSRVSEASSRRTVDKKQTSFIKQTPSPEPSKSSEPPPKPKIVDRKPSSKPPKHKLLIKNAKKPENSIIKEESSIQKPSFKEVIDGSSVSNEWRESGPDSDSVSICLTSQAVLEDTPIDSALSELVQTTSFSPQTVERLRNLFISIAGGEQEAMSYELFLNIVNSKLTSDRKLEDDRVTRRIFAVIDTDSDGLLNLYDFVKGLALITRSNKEEQFRLAFRIFDTDDDGAISRHELTRILKLNTATIKTDEQAMKKAHEILRMAGSSDLLTVDSFLSLKEKPLMLLAPLQERASKIGKLIV
jgi:Ca2+-binding EF-hand superfamily protein